MSRSRKKHTYAKIVKTSKAARDQKQQKPQRLLKDLLFPEGPRWHDGKLWFSDIHGHRVMTVDAEGTPAVAVECFFRPSGLGFLPDGRLLVVNMNERRLMRLDGSTLTAVSELAWLIPTEINDMAVDAQGRAYIGAMGVRGEAGTPRPDHLRPLPPERVEEFRQAGLADTPFPSSIARVDPDGSVGIVAEDVLTPNGMVITPDGKTLIVAETYGNRLAAFDIAEDGSLSNHRTWADLGDALPDGICLDAEGGVWVGAIYAHEFIRVLEGGEVTDRVPTRGDRLAIACALGGDDGRTLFLCTAVRPSRQIVPGITKGYIETVRVRVPGVGFGYSAAGDDHQAAL